MKHTLNLSKGITPVSNKEQIKLILTDANFDKIKIDYIHYQLYFTPKTPDQEKMFVYEAVLHQLKTDGLTNSYNLLYKEYKKWQYAKNGKQIINFFEKWWWNYGLNRGQILIWLALFIGIFTLIKTHYYDYFCSIFIDADFIKDRSHLEYLRKHPALYYINAVPKSLVLTIYLCFGSVLRIFWYQSIQVDSKNFLFSLYLFFMLLFGFIFFLFTVQWFISGVFNV